MWQGDYRFLLINLIIKDFRVRYRNMSLGVFWSLLNPLVLMGVLTFVFTKIFDGSAIPHFALFILCGLVPYNFFSSAWIAGTMSLTDNAAFIKRTPIPREILPLAAVLSTCTHLLIQIALLLSLAIVFGQYPNRHWLWLPVIWILQLLFVSGIALITSALNVYVRDMRYLVESINTVLFWLVPIFYPFSMIPQKYANIYEINPIAAIVLAMRSILLDGTAPRTPLMLKLTVVSVCSCGLGWFLFRRLKRRFYDYL